MASVVTQHATVSVKHVTIQARWVPVAPYVVLPTVLAQRVLAQALAQEHATERFARHVPSPTIRHSVACQAVPKVEKFRQQCATAVEHVHPVECVNARGLRAGLQRVVQAVTRM
jgi:hypothetical protein